MIKKSVLLLAFIPGWNVLADDTAPAAGSKENRHVWEYITYESKNYTFVIGGFGDKTDGFRVNIITGGRDMPDVVKKEAIVARIHRPGGTIVPGKFVGAGGTGNSPDYTQWTMIMMFPWSTNSLEEAWIEISIEGETYWLEVPYGFTRDPEEALSESELRGRPKRVPAMNHLNKHSHVVRWKNVHYDLGEIQNGWRLHLIQIQRREWRE